MGIIVAIRPSSSTGGASGVSRYIAESKREAEKEGLTEKEARPLFSSVEDNLTYWQADQILVKSTGEAPEKEDVIHIVISLEPEDFKDLGEDLDERKEAFREIIREAATTIEKEVDFEELNWVAGIHLNTKNPHAHLAFSRNGLDVDSHKLKRLEHLPRTLLPRNEKQVDKTKEFVQGRIAEVVSQGIERRRELVRERSSQTQEREHQLAPELEKSDHEHARTGQSSHEHNEAARTVEHEGPATHDEDLQHTGQQPPQGITAERTTLAETVPENARPDARLGRYDSLTSRDEPVSLPESEHTRPDPGLDFEAPDTHSHDSFEEPDAVLHFDEPAHGEEHGRGQSEPSDRVMRDRYVLGRSMVARGEVERLEAELKAATEHGDKRRFRVFDASHGRTRRISEFDIRRRADARAATAVREKEITDPDKRHEARQGHYDAELERHEKAIGDHQIILSKTIHKLEKKLSEARAEHAALKSQVRTIQRNYRFNGQDLPVPLVSPKEIGRLEEQAVSARDPGRVRTLEKIRLQLAGERKEPSRSDEEVARLEGQLLHARSEQAVRQERAEQFERNRHQTRWEIDGEKYSLSDLDRRIGDQEDRSRFFGMPLNIKTVHLLTAGRREAAAEAEHLKEVRGVVVERIEERRQELAEAVKEAGKMTAVLSKIHVGEQEQQRERGGERQEKTLTRGEINQLIEHATLISDSSMLHQAFILEGKFEDRLPDDKKTPLETQAARAIGREVMSEINVRQIEEHLESFKERKRFMPVVVKDLEGKDVTARLFDFRNSGHPVMWLAERAAQSKDQRHLRREVHSAVVAEHERLKEDATNARDCHRLTQYVAESFRDQLRSTGERVPEAAFSPKQVIQLEIYAARHHDPLERARVESLVNRAELAGHVHSPQTYEHDQRAAGTHHKSGFQEKAWRGEPARATEPGVDRMRTPEREHTSEEHLPQHQLRQTPAAQISQPHPAKEAPELDLLH